MHKKQIYWLFALAFLFLASCSPKAEPTPEATPTLQPPISITYCDINPSDVCLEGFGLDIEDRLLVLLKADDRSFADIYIRAPGPEGEMLMECEHSENFPENIYCLGESFPEGELIKLNIFAKSNNKLLAIGVFDVQYGNLPEPDVVFRANATETPPSESSYPNPSYPNPSYPNPTSAP